MSGYSFLSSMLEEAIQERDEARRELDAVEALLEEYDHRFNCSESWSQSDTLGKVDFLIKGYIILHGDSLIQRRKRNESRLSRLLQQTVVRFAKYDKGWMCASTDLPLQAFVDACKGSDLVTAEIQDGYWCVIRSIVPDPESASLVVWRSDYTVPRASDLQKLRDRFFSYVKEQEEAK